MLSSFSYYGYIVKNDVLAFQKGPLSQWWGGFKGQMGSFMINNIYYHTCEQWMMAEKARIMGDSAAVEAILLESNPATNQKQGRLIQSYDQGLWDSKKEEVIFDGNIAKFGQNEELKDFLFSTNGLTLVEAAPWDKIYGCGTGYYDERTFNPAEWQGQNLLGKCLILVRQELNKT